MGPQVGYYVPQILMEEDLHGPGIDARGAAFPGVNLYVELGHGRDYAWSATTATSDNVDTFAEVLCKDKFHYLYSGKCLPMEKLEQTRELDAERDRLDPAGLADADRLPHRARDRLRPRQGRRQEGRLRPAQRSTYFHEADSVIGFAQLNEPGFVTGAAAASSRRSPTSTSSSTGPTSTPNTSPTRCRAAMPQRAQGHLAGLPDPRHRPVRLEGLSSRRPHTPTCLPFAKHPQAVDPPFLVSWNNKQAPGWAAADDKYAYGPIFRSQMIADQVKAGDQGQEEDDDRPAGPGDGGTGDRRTCAATGCCRRSSRRSASRSQPTLQQALATLQHLARSTAPTAATSTATAIDEETPAIELMDAWWPKLVEAEFRPALGAKAFERARRDARDRRATPAARRPHRTSPTAGGATSPRTCATSTGRSRRAPRAASTAATARSRSAGRCCSETLRQALQGDPGSSSTAAATATAPPTRSRPASTRTGRGDRRHLTCRRSRSRTGRPSSRW